MKCSDEEGYIDRNEDGEEVWKFCDCKERKKIERAFKTSKVTNEFQKKTFDAFELKDRLPIVQDAYQCALSYYSNFERVKKERHNSIALLGRPGCGKTHLLMAIANGLMNKGIQLLYFPWVEGFNEIKGDLSQTEERINRMQKVDLLYIDDMFKGRGKPTEFQLEQAFAVINYRYMEKLPVLISSEYDIEKMLDFDEALGSRINEMCKDFRVVLTGDRDLNYRLREDAM